MLDIFFDYNQFDELHPRQSMNAHKTYRTINDVCEHLILQHMPYHVFDIMWRGIDRFDRYIYEEIDDDIDDLYYTDYVHKGSYKNNKKKNKRLKINKAIRYMSL